MPEKILWSRLRANKLELKFRRQHALGPWIADFYCHVAGLVIEIDGWNTHGRDKTPDDPARDFWMTSRGLEIMRLWAGDVSRSPDACAASIVARAHARIAAIEAFRRQRATDVPPPSPRAATPPPRGAGEGAPI